MKYNTGSGTRLPSTYKAVAVSSSEYGAMILTSDGYLYGTGNSSALGGVDGTTGYFTRLDGVASGLPAHTAANPIVDFTGGTSETYVLYSNGDLYRLASSTVTRIATNIKMFDKHTGNGTDYCYAVTSANKIQIYKTGTLSTTITPTGTVTQVRGSCGSGWGYLNSDGDLYIATSATSNASKVNTDGTKVVCFDIGTGLNGSGANYGALTTTGVLKIWGSFYGTTPNCTGSSYTSGGTPPTSGGGVDHNYFGESGLGQNTPPAFIFLAYLSHLFI